MNSAWQAVCRHFLADFPRLSSLRSALTALLLVPLPVFHAAEVQKAEMAGYLLVSADKAPDDSQTFARVAPTSFPVGPEGQTVVLHRLTTYTKKALWDGVKAWFDGGAEVCGAINSDGAHVQTLCAEGGSTWKIYAEKTPTEQKVAMTWKSFATPIAQDPVTPPKGFEIGYVPIATRQELDEASKPGK